MFWYKCSEVASLSDAELESWHNRGVDGFICSMQHLRNLGGEQAFTADKTANLDSESYGLQRGLRESNIVARAKRLGMKMYLGFYLVNELNSQTPLAEWFDETAWSNTVVPAFREVAGAARSLGFDGIGFDQELYPQGDGKQSASWAWNYPGNNHPEAEVRAMAKARGQQLMRAILQEFPAVEITAYATQFPETWEEVIQEEVNGNKNLNAPLLHLNFWDGLSSVEGYSAIRMVNATFYKTTHVGVDWDVAFQYHYNRLFALLSRSFSNWSYASKHLYESPFIWISDGSTKFENARSPSAVAEQLEAFSKWGMGGEFANFVFEKLGTFDYGPYLPAMNEASSRGTVDAEPPSLIVTSPPGGAPERSATATVSPTGAAKDNFAIKAVRWRNDRGGEGMARLTWRSTDGKYGENGRWEMQWTADGIALQPGVNRIELTAEDIKGLTSTRTLEITSAAPLPG